MEINVLADAKSLLEVARSRSGGRRNGNLQRLKQLNAQRNGGGRPGAPRPINIQQTGLSNRARALREQTLNVSFGFLAGLIDATAIRQETENQLREQNQFQELIERLQESQNRGRNTNISI